MTIEEILEITNHIENIDGEDVYIVEKGMYKELEKLKQRINLESADYVFQRLKKDVEFVCNHSDFAIAFRPVKWVDDRKWIPCLIYNYAGEWRRVILQYANCLKCNWTGNVANPTDPDLYFTMKNKFQILKEMNKLPFLKCPKCGSEISTKAIWLEDCKFIWEPFRLK